MAPFGVVLFKEIVPRWSIAAIARRTYGKKYVTCPIRSMVEPPSGGAGYLSYACRSFKEKHLLDVVIGGAAALPVPGSEAGH